MARERRFDIEDLTARPGTYFNPQTEVLVIIDDSTSIDSEIFNMEEFEGADWVLISDDVPVDESHRDEILENFQATFHGATGRIVVDDEDVVDDEEEEDGGPEELDADANGFGDEDR